MGDVEPHEAGLASGVVNTSFMMGGALGLAVLVAVSDSRTATLAAGGAGPVEGRCTAGCRSPSRSVRSSPLRRRGRWGVPPAAADDDARGRRRARLRRRLPGALRGLTLVTDCSDYSPAHMRRPVVRTVSYKRRSGTAHPGHCPTTWSVTYRDAGDQSDDPAGAPGPDRACRGTAGAPRRRPRGGRSGQDPRHAPRLAARHRGGRRRRPLVRAGLWDQHVHLSQWTSASQRLDLAPARSPEQALAMVAERIAGSPVSRSSAGDTGPGSGTATSRSPSSTR